jgi:diamine N-acetyltransferase
MNIAVREATESDFPAVLGLVKELAVFEKAEHKVKNSVEQMEAEKDCFNCLVAETDNGEVVGMALYFFAYYTWVGKSIYLDDLYVKQAYRKQHVGTALIKEFFKIARKENCKRARWQTLNWNEKMPYLFIKSTALSLMMNG